MKFAKYPNFVLPNIIADNLNCISWHMITEKEKMVHILPLSWKNVKKLVKKDKHVREAFQSKKQPNLRGWDFFELGTFLKWVDPPPKINLGLGNFFKRNDPLKNFWNKLNMKNIGTKSVNMSDIMVYLAMFSTTIGPHNMKMSHQFISLWYPLKLGTFFTSEDPPLILNYSQLKLGTFLIFWRPPLPPIWTNSQVSLLFQLESFP